MTAQRPLRLFVALDLPDPRPRRPRGRRRRRRPRRLAPGQARGPARHARLPRRPPARRRRRHRADRRRRSGDARPAARARRDPAPAAAARPRPHRRARGPRRHARGAAGPRLGRRSPPPASTRPEKRPFRAHVTVARLRPRVRPPRAAALEPEPLAFAGRAVTLYVSRLHPSGARYEPLASRVAERRLTASAQTVDAPAGRPSSAARAPRPPEPGLGRPQVRPLRRLRGRPLRDAGRPARPRGRRARGDPAAHRARGAVARADADVSLRRARRRGRERDAGRARGPAGARRALPPDRLRPARHRPLRAAALPAAGARPVPALDRRRRGLRGAARRQTQALHDRGVGRRHGGDPGRGRRREADAVRDLLRHGARGRLRARPSRPRRAPDPGLGGRHRGHRPVLHRRLPRDGAVAALAVPGGLPRHLARSGRRPRATRGPGPRQAAHTAAPTTSAGARTGSGSARRRCWT